MPDVQDVRELRFRALPLSVECRVSAVSGWIAERDLRRPRSPVGWM